MALFAIGVLGCESELTIGRFVCADSSTETAVGVGTATPPRLVVPWSTGFETGFCDYFSGGYCYSQGNSTFEIVTEPVHGGSYAAAYSVNADGSGSSFQARCVRNGVLPSEAYYGAYYFVPVAVTNAGLWNLFHFQGGTDQNDTLHGLWDVSVVNDTSGALELLVYSFLGGQTWELSEAPRLPIAQWFHLEVYLKRASDTTGAFSLYLDGSLVLELVQLVTDDSAWGEWYVGNWADQLTPAQLTVYVDDVTVSTTR